MKKKVFILMLVVLLGLPISINAQSNGNELWDIPFGLSVSECTKQVGDEFGIVLRPSSDTPPVSRLFSEGSITVDGIPTQIVFTFTDDKLVKVTLSLVKSQATEFTEITCPDQVTTFFVLDALLDAYFQITNRLYEVYGKPTHGRIWIGEEFQSSKSYAFPQSDGMPDEEALHDIVKGNTAGNLDTVFGNIDAYFQWKLDDEKIDFSMYVVFNQNAINPGDQDPFLENEVYISNEHEQQKAIELSISK